MKYGKMVNDFVNGGQGGYSQNFFSLILKIFVTLTWKLEPIKLKK